MQRKFKLLTCAAIFNLNLYAAFEFLNLDNSARVASLGGAYVGLADDLSSINYNPAGLAKISINQLLITYNSHFAGINYAHIAFASPKKFGIAITYLNYGKIKRTTLSNPSGEGLGYFTISDFSLIVGYGNKVYIPELNCGGNIKLITEKIDNVLSSNVCIDLGVNYELIPDELSFGLSVQNIGLRSRYKEREEGLPFNLKAGVGYFPFKNLIFVFDLNKTRRINFVTNFGVEYLPLEVLSLRVGYNGRSQAGIGLCFGIGFTADAFFLDYGLSSYGDLGISHKFSLTFGF